MNDRDPFGLRQSRVTPLNLLRGGAALAARTVIEIQEKVEEYSTILLDPEHEYPPPRPAPRSLPTGMSKDFNSANQDKSWQKRRMHSRTDSLIADIQGIFKGQEELPMYKDKPYNYTPSGRRSPVWRRKRFLAFLLCLFGLFYYSTGGLSNIGRVAHGVTRLGDSAFVWEDRRDRVREAFKLSWKCYEDHAWGYDEYHPISKRGRQMVPDGMGWIIVDALDTMMLMNLTTELSHAREWLAHNLTYDKDHDVNTFETTIRNLGGLLAAHYLSKTYPDMAPLPANDTFGEDLYLERASDLADRLLGAYSSKSGIPYASVNLKTREGIVSHDDGGASSTAEAATLQLEMKYLSKLTGEVAYWEAAEKVIQVIDDNGAEDGLVPIFIYADEGKFRGQNIRLGSRGDSYYEYLIKQYLQTYKQEPIYNTMWLEALAGVRKHLVTYTANAHLTIIGEKPDGLSSSVFPKMDHLVCFMPGTIALGATGGMSLDDAKRDHGWGAKQEADIKLARELMKTCWGMYAVSKTGLSPEIAHFRLPEHPPAYDDPVPPSPPTLSDDPYAEWRKDFDIHSLDWHNLQRPETVESLFYMWRITKDPIYREWGWKMFQSFMKHTFVNEESGFSSIDHVDHIPSGWRDNMESFWLAETLKYFYLLFGPDDVLPLEEIVFNTEAHPFPRFEMGKLFKTGWQRKPRGEDGKMIRDPSTDTAHEHQEHQDTAHEDDHGSDHDYEHDYGHDNDHDSHDDDQHDVHALAKDPQRADAHDGHAKAPGAKAHPGQ